MDCSVIGIGGTGARCVESLVNLCAAGLGPKELFVLLIDPDLSNGNVQRTQRLIEDYQEAYSILYGSGRGDSVSDSDGFRPTFGTKLRFGLRNEPSELVWSPTLGLDAPRDLGELFDYFRKPKGQNLCNAFYSKYELDELKWGVGFRGHASVASPAMAEVRECLDVQPWASLLSAIKSTLSIKEHRTFIFASAFGATGAGGFPVIAQVLRNVAADADPKWVGRERFMIGGALLLPYLSFELPPNTAPEDCARPEYFLMNTQAALMHYQRAWKDGSPYDAAYLVGSPDLSKIDIPELGGKAEVGGIGQRNPAHLIEVLSAMAALDFYSRPLNAVEVGDRRRECRPYALRSESATEMAWGDLPDVPYASKARVSSNVQRQLSTYATMIGAYSDFFYPLIGTVQFEKSRHLSPWYRKYFANGALSDAVATSGLKVLHDFAVNQAFPWLWQWHSTCTNRKLRLFNGSYLEAHGGQKDKWTLDQRRRMLANVLDVPESQLQRSRALDDGFTAIWDNMCRQREPTTMAPVAKLWHLLFQSAAEYSDIRYGLGTTQKKIGV